MVREVKDGHTYINGKPFRTIDGKLLMTKKELSEEMLLSVSRVNRMLQTGMLTAYLENGQPKPVESRQTVYVDYWQWKSIGKENKPVGQSTGFPFNRFAVVR